MYNKSDYVVDKIIEDIRNGSWKKWSYYLKNDIFKNNGIVESLRSKVTSADVGMICDLLASDDNDSVYIGHCLSRPFRLADGFSKNDIDKIRKSTESAFGKTTDILTKLGFIHDLLEYEDYTPKEHPEIESFFDENKENSKFSDALFFYFSGEHKLFDFCFSTLNERFSKNNTLSTSQKKAFLYVHYLGMLRDVVLREKAEKDLAKFHSYGDEYFKCTLQKVLINLKPEYSDYVVDKIIDDIRNDRWKKWDDNLWKEFFTDRYTVDNIRKKIGDKDIPLICKLLSDKDVKSNLLAHYIQRYHIADPQVREKAEDVFNGTTDTYIKLCFLHDLLELEDWHNKNRESVIAFVKGESGDDIAKALIDFFKPIGGEEALCDFCISRLTDVFGEKATGNTSDKAYLYVYYMGVLKDEDLKVKAKNELRQFKEKGDKPFETAYQEVVNIL